MLNPLYCRQPDFSHAGFNTALLPKDAWAVQKHCKQISKLLRSHDRFLLFPGL